MTYLIERLHDLVVVSVEGCAVDVLRHLLCPLRVTIREVPLIGQRDNALQQRYWRRGVQVCVSALQGIEQSQAITAGRITR